MRPSTLVILTLSLLRLLLTPQPLRGQYTIQTVAGTTASSGSGNAIETPLAFTEGVATDRAGNVYVCDTADHRVRRITTAGRIENVAGTGAPGFSGDGGPAAQAQLSSPYGIAVDRTGNVFIADLGNARVRRVGTDGTIRTIAGGGTTPVNPHGARQTALQVKLEAPRNVIADADGNLYISDFGAHRILQWLPNGNLGSFAGTGQAGDGGDAGHPLLAQLNSPAGLALDRNGALYIADSGNKKIRKVFAGLIQSVTGTGLNPRGLNLNTVTGIAIDSTSNLYVADGRDNPSRRVTPQGLITTLPAGGRDVAVDGFGGVVLSDGPYVKKVNLAGGVLVIGGSGDYHFAGDGGAALEARFNQPAGLARDTAGYLYVADRSNHRIRRVNPAGAVETVVGTGEAGYAGDNGPAIAARLSYPAGLAMDASGVLFFVDANNHVVRKLTADGRIENFAGTGVSGTLGDGGPAKYAQFNTPLALAFDALGNLYVADTGNHKIRRITPGGIITTFAGTGEPGNLGDGVRATQARLRSPAGLTVDSNGVVWISDTGNNRVRKVLADGTMSVVHDGGVAQPLGLAVDGAGTLYIADSGNNRIRAIKADGAVSTVAGTGAAGYSGDGGLATMAQLNGPGALLVMSAPAEAASVIWFADANNQRIRMLYRGGDIGESQIQPGKLVHAATNREGAIAPGQIVTLYGTGLGPVAGRAGSLSQGSIPLALEGVELQFDGLAAPLFYVSETQINAQVPYRVAGRARVQVDAKYQGFSRYRGTAELVDAAPGLFLVGGASTQCAALNQDGSLNGPANPAALGSIVVLYSTGEGLTDPVATEGRPAAPPLAKPMLPVRIELNGIATQILYAGAAPGFSGLMQINIRVPATGIRPGNVPVTLKVGSYASPAGATIAVK